MTANNFLWALSLLLELLLLAALVFRREARRLPLFTALIAFYLVRSVLLFALFGHIDPPAYDLTYTTLSSLDLLLQTAVAWELLGASTPRFAHARLTTFGGLILVSAAFAWLLSLALPATVRTPVDRGVLFTSALMLAVFLATADRFRRALPTHFLRGFAALAAAGILTQIGRTLAALHRDARALHRWSWLAPAVYLAVLAVWLIVSAAHGAADKTPCARNPAPV